MSNARDAGQAAMLDFAAGAVIVVRVIMTRNLPGVILRLAGKLRATRSLLPC